MKDSCRSMSSAIATVSVDAPSIGRRIASALPRQARPSSLRQVMSGAGCELALGRASSAGGRPLAGPCSYSGWP